MLLSYVSPSLKLQGVGTLVTVGIAKWGWRPRLHPGAGQPQVSGAAKATPAPSLSQPFPKLLPWRSPPQPAPQGKRPGPPSGRGELGGREKGLS